MNVSKFVVLGTLDLLGLASGYDIFRELDRKMISRWTSVKKGSIYHALKAMNKSGEIREVTRQKKGLFPTMTLYEITEVGRNLFDKMQEEAFLGLYPHFYGFKIGLKFNVRRSNEEINIYADKAVDIIDLILAGMDEYLNSLPKSDERLEIDRFFIEHDKMLYREEKRWIKMVVERLGTFSKTETVYSV